MNELLSLVGSIISLPIINVGVRLMKNYIIEDEIKDLNKKVLFDYLIENRIFINNLSDEDIKHYKKIFSMYYRDRLKNKIKNFFHINIIKNEEGS